MAKRKGMGRARPSLPTCQRVRLGAEEGGKSRQESRSKVGQPGSLGNRGLEGP